MNSVYLCSGSCYRFVTSCTVGSNKTTPLLGSGNLAPIKLLQYLHGCVRIGQHLAFPFHQAHMVAEHCFTYKSTQHTFAPLHRAYRSGKHSRSDLWTQTRPILFSRTRSSTVPAKFLPYIYSHVGDLDSKQDLLLKLKESFRLDKDHCEVH